MRTMTMVGVLAGVCALGGCAGEVGASSPDAPTAFEALVDMALVDARDAGADPEQIRMLEEVREAGEVTFEVLVEAFENEILCVEDAGIPTEAPYTFNSWGVLNYGYMSGVPDGMTDDEQGQITFECAQKYRVFLDEVYANQPSSIEAYESLLEAALPTIQDCLVREGVADAGSMTVFEAYDAAILLNMDQWDAGDPEPADCLGEAGVKIGGPLVRSVGSG